MSNKLEEVFDENDLNHTQAKNLLAWMREIKAKKQETQALEVFKEACLKWEQDHKKTWQAYSKCLYRDMQTLTNHTIRQVYKAMQRLNELGLSSPTYIDGKENVYLFKDPDGSKYLFNINNDSILSIDADEKVRFQEDFIQVFTNSKDLVNDNYVELDYSLD